MCVVSAVGDNWQKRADDIYPWATQPPSQIFLAPEVTRAEFDALKAEMEALRTLLEAAKKFDEETGQPDCEVDDKVELIRRVAKLVGVDMSSVFIGGEDE